MAPDTNYPDRDPRDTTITQLRQQLAATIAAMAWTGEVYPSTNAESGGALVCMTWDQFNTMRVLAGGKPRPARKAESLVVDAEYLRATIAERDRAVKDAERLDWAHENAHLLGWDSDGNRIVIRADDGAVFSAETWRGAIDAAIAAGGEEKTNV